MTTDEAVAEIIVDRLTADNINSELIKTGLPTATVLEAAKVLDSSKTSTPEPSPSNEDSNDVAFASSFPFFSTPVLVPLVRRQSSLLKLAEMKKPPLKRQPDGAWGDKSAAVTDAASASKAGEGRPPPLYRVDTEDLISLDPESPDDLVTAGSRKATIADTSSKRLR